MLTLDEFIKKLPEDEQKRIARGDRLFKYIIEKRCKHPEMLKNPELLDKQAKNKGA